MSLIDKFSQVAGKTATVMGHPVAFGCALLLIAIWVAAGSSFEWSQAHSLVINTITTIITFLLGFLILNTTSMSGKAEQLKLDELIHAIKTANNNFIKLEQKSSKDVEQMGKEMDDEVKEKGKR